MTNITVCYTSVHIVGSYEGRQFYDKDDLEYLLGEGELQQLPEGVDRAIRRINKGEKCRVTIKGRFGFGTAAPAEFNLPANADLVYTIFLKDFEKVRCCVPLHSYPFSVSKAYWNFRPRPAGSSPTRRRLRRPTSRRSEAPSS